MLLLPSSITAEEAPSAQRMLAQVLQHEPDAGVVVDASSLKHFDSSALAVLLECRRLAQAWGKAFVVRNAPPKLEALARLYGVDVLLMEGAVA
jgi:phospholipid transport system transporter-binding protein